MGILTELHRALGGDYKVGEGSILPYERPRTICSEEDSIGRLLSDSVSLSICRTVGVTQTGGER